MATFKFLVLPHQRKEDGTYNVKVRVTQKGKSKYIKTNQNVSASDISKRKENGKEKIKIKNQAVIDLMEELILGFKKKLISAGVNAEYWDVDRIVEHLTTDIDDFRLNFIAYGRKVADEKEKEGRIGTAKQYRIAINALVRFVGKEELDINIITVSFMRSFEKHLKTEPSFKGRRTGESVPTDLPKGKRAISLYPAHIKTIHNLAKLEYNDEDRGIIRIPLSPFAKYKVAPIPKSEHRTLTTKQVQQIIDLPYKKFVRGGGQPLLNLAKDLFILSFSMMGMNSADFYDATDITGNIVTYQRVKTRNRREDMAETKVRIEPEIKALFEKYADPSNERVFVFYKRYKDASIFNKMINKGMKDVGKAIGVPDLNYYYARHTMATLAANKAGIDIARVDEMLNHSDSTLKLARVYVQRDYSVLWKANRKILALFKWDSLKEKAGE